MTPEQLQVAKADMNKGLADNATSPTTGRLDGKKLLAQVESNREVLTAAGFTKAEIGRIERIAKQLQVTQSRSPQAATQLLEDNVGFVLNLAARLAGSKGGSRILQAFGGAGAGGSLILTQFGSKTMRNTLKNLSVDKADALLRASFDDKELFAALLTKPTDSLKRQAEAARTLNAFLLEPARNQTAPTTQVPVGAKGSAPGESIQNSDGTQSSEQTISVGFGDETFLIPTVIPDKDGFLVKRSDEEAIKLFKAGKNPSVGTFDSVAEADAFAARRSAGGGRFSDITPESE